MLAMGWISNDASMKLLSNLIILLFDPTISVAPLYMLLAVWIIQGLSMIEGHGTTIFLKVKTLMQSDSG